jgi:hypothetical protein
MDHSHKSAGDGLVSDSTSQTGMPSATPTGGFCASAPCLSPPSLPLRAGNLSMPEVIDLYMALYGGRDTSRIQRLGWWKQRLRDRTLQDLLDRPTSASQRSRFTSPMRPRSSPLREPLASYVLK